MGTLTFQLPAGLPPDLSRELERACLIGGPDTMPYPTRQHLLPDRVLLQRPTDESGYVVAPWALQGGATLMCSSATLMERSAPYHLLVELARGKINQVRNQLVDWESAGLKVAPELRTRIHQASLRFGRAVCSGNQAELLRETQHALDEGHRASGDLVEAYIRQVMQIRHQHQDKLETALAIRLASGFETPPFAEHITSTFNRVSVPISWHQIEAEEARYNWAATDRMLDWAERAELDVIAGPLIDFSSTQLPAWLWVWERDVHSMATFMSRFVEAAVRRYRSRIRRWQLTAATNWASVLSLSEEEMLGLTFRLGEAARQIDPTLEIILGISQPWGEYMTASERTSPFIFADNLIRSGLNLAAINLEIVMGVRGRGTYCRDSLELSRLLDLYALLGVPQHVTLGYPHTEVYDPEGDPELAVGFGHWAQGFTPQTQAAWARHFVSLALCKRYVQSVSWVHLSDSLPHLFPGCGLIDSQGKPLPALETLRQLRQDHLL
ncbi:MAG: endo-1,4-beta-xylanase [Gemmataceae bacterium]